jgi:hypothetical protein
LDKNNKTLITSALRAASTDPEVISTVLSILEGKAIHTAQKPKALLSQAEKAKQLGVSRFTIRKMTLAGKLHPIELLPGLYRYRADELV